MEVRRMSVRDARANFSDLLGSVHYTNQPVIIEKKGKPFAVVISPGQFEGLERWIERAWETVDRISARNADKDPDEVLRDVTRLVEEVRAQMDEEERQAAKRGG